MKLNKIIITSLTAVVLIFALAAILLQRLSRDDLQYYVPWSIARLLYPSDDIFITHDIPLKESHWIYDTGIVDANSDGLLDIYTTNHNWRQRLLISDGNGGYSENLTTWKLDQISEFPGAEISTVKPNIHDPGIYIYWYNRHLYIQSHEIDASESTSIWIDAYTDLDITSNNGFHIDTQESSVLSSPLLTKSSIQVSSSDDAILELYPRSRGVPINFKISRSLPLSNVFVGSQLVVPSKHEFSLPLQDRHAMAWSDYNDDGLLDIFITRGAIGGTLRLYPDDIKSSVNEEFFVSSGSDYLSNTIFNNIITDTGIVKDGCSARHASWVDYDTDGLLDLFINCEDVGNIEGKYPNKLHQRQQTQHDFVEVAEQIGLAILDNNIIDYEWFDIDNDFDMDLLAHQDDGYWLYRNQKGRFESEFIYRAEFSRIDHPHLKGESGAYWIFDGKVSVSDYDGDGDFDVFSASKKGNTLLTANDGTLSAIDPTLIGLPAYSVSASWVDYDNDGMLDLHTVPDGIYRQNRDHTFTRTYLLILPSDTYMASIINWYDLNNDGTRDVLIALNKNPTLLRWWELSEKDTFLWQYLTYLNTYTQNHWLQIDLEGKPGNREAIGARVSLTTPDGMQTQEVGLSDGAFYSQGHYRLYFGLGPHKTVDSVKIRWPEGEVQELKHVKGDKLHKIMHPDL